MDYRIIKNQIKVYSLREFNPEHIFECGQVFAYEKIDAESYIFYPKDKIYLIYKEKDCYIIEQIGGKIDLQETVNVFDLDTDYTQIKKNIARIINKQDFKLDREIIKKSLLFGYGIRILKQDCFETIISFVFSQNNNIKRIKSSLDKLREKLGSRVEIDYSNINDKNIIDFFKNKNFYSFPTFESLKKCSEEFFVSLGLGYRAKYLIELLKQLEEIDLENIRNMETTQLRNCLIKLKGIGKKVANCILLFGFSKIDVFPVDTWISQIYNDLTNNKNNISAEKISDILEENFKSLSGYIQQYLFYYKRSFTD